MFSLNMIENTILEVFAEKVYGQVRSIKKQINVDYLYREKMEIFDVLVIGIEIFFYELIK